MGEVAVALLLAPAPFELTKELERLELLLKPGGLACVGGATVITKLPTIPIHKVHWVKLTIANNLLLV